MSWPVAAVVAVDRCDRQPHGGWPVSSPCAPNAVLQAAHRSHPRARPDGGVDWPTRRRVRRDTLTVCAGWVPARAEGVSDVTKRKNTKKHYLQGHAPSSIASPEAPAEPPRR
jgi:hypothetical protein